MLDTKAPDARHFCPDCGGIDLQISRKYLLLAEAEDTGATARCPNCGWEGLLSKTVGAVSSEQFWDIERVGEVLLRVVSKHAAGPFIQVMEFTGLLPRRQEHVEGEDGRKCIEHNEMVDEMRTQVVRAMLEGAITRGFEAAEQAHRSYADKMGTAVHDVLADSAPKSFGGTVTPIDRKRGKQHD